MNKQEFVDIKGYEGLYQVNYLGVVRSLDRHVGSKAGSKMFIRGKILKPAKDSYGYLMLTLRKNSIGRNTKIHRLIAQHFIPNPNNHPLVDHKDGNTLNNDIENLRWCTYVQNCSNRKTIYSKIYKGVAKTNRGNYEAKIMTNGKMFYIGVYDTPEQAGMAYNDMALKLHGEFAQLNVIRNTK